MTIHNNPIQKAQIIAQELLAKTFGGPVQLDQGISPPDHSHVFRFIVKDGPANAPDRIIAKCTRHWGQMHQRADTTEPFPGAQRLFNDWAGVQFLGQVAEKRLIVPRFYAGDPTNGLFLMEDLGDQPGQEEVLLGTETQKAHRLLINIAETLGTLHAQTIGKEETYRSIRIALGSESESEAYDQLTVDFRIALERLGLTLRPGLDKALSTVVASLQEPGPFLTYTHGDPCPDNAKWVDDELRWVDFEGGGYRHALIDGVYGRIHFPSCWCVNRIPDPIWQEMETRYRAALAQNCPAAQDDELYQKAVTTACIYWGLMMFRYHPNFQFERLLAQDRVWGIATNRQRVLLRSDIIAQTTQAFGYLEVIGATFADLTTHLRKQWISVDELPNYPAFQRENIVQIREFEHTAEDYNAVVQVMNTVWREPIYTADDLRHDDEERPSQLVHRRFVAEANEQIVGFGSFSHNERFYHRQRFWIHLDVLPDWRQRGIGTKLYDHMLALMQADYSANQLHADTTDSRDHSIRFLENRGFREDKRDPKSRLELAKFDWARFQGLDAKIAAMGIEIRALSDLLQDDPNALYQVYELHQMLVQNVPDPAPRTKVDYDSWKDGYSSSNPYYLPEAHFMALHDGEYIGLTSLWGLKTDEKLYTGMSGVKREYRRKGLVTALKLRSIAFAQAQGTRVLMTSNNSANPMLQLNLKLGFKIYDAHLKFVRQF